MTLRDAAQALVAQLDAIAADGHCTGVFAFYEIHGLSYSGPTYEEELKALKKVLEEPHTPPSHAEN